MEVTVLWVKLWYIARFCNVFQLATVDVNRFQEDGFHLLPAFLPEEKRDIFWTRC